MAKGLDKFLLLMWKNFTILKRHPIQTLIEILVPAALIALLVGIRSVGLPIQHGAVLFLPFDNKFPIYHPYNITIAWSPPNPHLRSIVRETASALESRLNLSSYTFQETERRDSADLEGFLTTATNMSPEDSYNVPLVFGVQFDDALAGDTALSPLMNVTIRYRAETRYGGSDWSTDALIPTFKEPGPRDIFGNEGADPSYHDEGFLSLQEELSFSIISYFKVEEHGQPFDRASTPILMQRFPYPKWTEDFLMLTYQFAMSMIFVISMIYTSVSVVKMIAVEKERQLKETMKIMGLPGWLHWTAWFVTVFLLLLVTIVLIMILLMVHWFPRSDYAVITHSDPSLVFFFLLFYICASITFFFMISVLFRKATTASIFAGVLWFLAYIPYSLLQTSYNDLSLGEKLAASLLSNSAMSLGVQLILTFETSGEGIHWDSVWSPASATDTLYLGHILIMLVVDALLYLMITVYIEAISPGEFGVPQPWYFPFTKAYWCGTSQNMDTADYDDRPAHNEFYEEEPSHLEAGIKIQHLRKEFSSKMVAVKDLSLNIFKDQITVLLGHNGAGKTTTMSMLTGMFPPTSGTATVGGHDIRRNIAGVRDSLGLCPQHNILFDELTVKEHLYFFAKLKGLSKQQINDEIKKYVEVLELKDKTNARSSTLSGGMKRKLSVGVALCGGSSVVMCDEPSSGMDPAARRALWDILQSQKKGRTILLTTHFMDEADVLGDRIAIMAEGELQCAGSSFFLKKKYGAGYHLIMDISTSCNPNEVTNLLRRYIPDIKIESHIGSELRYVLIDDYSSVFQAMLGDLETQSNSLGINSYGISLTNLDEVFMKVRASSERNKEKENGQDNRPSIEDHSNGNYDQIPATKLNVGVHYLSGWPLWTNQITAMFMKRGLVTYRVWYQAVLQNVIAVVFLLTTFIIIRNFGVDENLPLLKIELDSYNDPITAVSYFSGSSYAQRYKDYLSSNEKQLLDWGDSIFMRQMLAETEENPSLVSARYLVGATFWESNTITAWFNNDPYHTPPLALQMVMNAILHAEVSPAHYIQINNHPLPFRTQNEEEQLFSPIGKGFNVAVNGGFGLGVASAFFIMFYVRERFNRAKHLQFVSGVRVFPFWLSAFVFDFVMYLVTCCCLIIVFVAFQETNYSTSDELGYIFSVLLYFGFAVLPLSYLMSFRYDIPSTGFVRMVLINIMLGIAPFMLTHFLDATLKDYNLDVLFRVVFMFSPVYAFCTGIRDIDRMRTTIVECTKIIDFCLLANETEQTCYILACLGQDRCCNYPSLAIYNIEEPGIGLNVLLACIAGILYFLILFGIEYHFFDAIRYKICSGRKYAPPNPSTLDDSDVLQEKEKLRTGAPGEISKYRLAMRDVTKLYKKHAAVNGLSLGVNKNECFGLLGINGAGKTTTFKMMTGDLQITYGDAWVNGLSLKSNMKKVHKIIGYCPQFDALLDDLTCWETLIMFSLIRGIPMAEAKLLAQQLAREFDFYPHLRKRVKQLSGGNKRKLSTAVALIGEPQVLYLDEPTTGMDPATKRYLWKVLCKIRDQGTCIILTSHSMEECEALCTRLAIMVNGVFKCLGSTQHLKSKFAQGYTLTVKVPKLKGTYEERNAQLNVIEQFVLSQFRGATVRERHEDLMTFYTDDTTLKWSEMFAVMESGKKSLNIEDYSLGQCTLEQVFLAFTKNQFENSG